MNRNTAYRRSARKNKIMRRLRVIQIAGYQGGTMYELHVEKIKANTGYMSKHGTMRHYTYGTTRARGKVRDRKRYGRSERWPVRDLRLKDGMDAQEKES